MVKMKKKFLLFWQLILVQSHVYEINPHFDYVLTVIN